MNQRHGLLALPAEIIEEIATYLYSEPRSIASLAETNRLLHGIIYESPDQHLWRRIFLMLFDDPRHTHALLYAAGMAGVFGRKFHNYTSTYQWKKEFQGRIAARNLFYRAQERRTETATWIEENPAKLYEAVRALLSLYADSSPYFYHPLLYDILAEPGAPAMAGCPPLAVILATSLADHEEPGLNSTWLSQILSSAGFPPIIIGKFIADPFRKESDETFEMHRKSWDYSEDGMAFWKLMFYTGFPPSPSPERDLFGPQYTEQEKMKAIAVSKYRVYNMPYLEARRHWGPFCPWTGTDSLAPTHEERPSIVESPTMHAHQQSLSALFLLDHLPVEEDDDTFSIASSTEEMQNEQTTLALLQNLPLNSEENQSESSNAPLFPDKPHLVLPDYRFLAHARVITEDKLLELFMKITHHVPTPPGMHDVDDFQRALAISLGIDPVEARQNERPLLDALGEKLHSSLRSLELARMGGVPGFWYSGWDEEGFLPDPQISEKARDKAKESKEVEGWDWACIEGHWVQSVNWLDYHDLIDFNDNCLDPHRDELPETAHLDETHHTIHVSLRVDHYERVPAPELSEKESADPKIALVYRLPVIHVVGESRFGNDIDFQPRRMVGTVRMIGDGAIRLSLLSKATSDDPMEWSSESVQMGSIGSAYGFVGLWTSGEHSRGDPIGPLQMWKYK